MGAGISAWGRLLLLKAGLVTAMGVLALDNRLRATPRLERNPVREAAHLRRNAVAELALAVAVFAVVALLGTLPPQG